MTEAGVPFRAGQEGYAGFRVPAVVATRTGDLLAFCEGRVGSRDDFGNIDVVLKRSTDDGGRTWGPLQVAARNGDALAGNPAPVVLDTGRVLLVHVRNAALATEDAIRRGTVSAVDGRRAWVRHSDDEGRTWSAPQGDHPGDQAARMTLVRHHPRARDPAHHRQSRRPRQPLPAAHRHRSLPPTGTDNGTEGRYNGGHCLLSDDAGATWRTGCIDDDTDRHINANETTAAELPDGRVYFNTRNDSPSPGTRADAHSADGGRPLVKPFHPQAGLTAPVCEAAVPQLRDPDLLLYSGPADPGFRALTTIRASTDGGTTWRPAYTVDGLPAAYSDLVRIDTDTVGLLYETGDFGAYETITFRRVPVTELT
ncbi:sialidase family protein [Streptomyces massasporeus]|uniref:exo-alpha-sialidase n=1 Tax=Streptomyces massasporeus TaxID=67324 RepID=A0ABW6LCT4_9ACTN